MELHTNVFRRLAVLSVGLALAVFCNAVAADPPGRVARLAYISGAVSFSPAGEEDWDEATINRPLSPGDRLWADTGARTELQLGGTMVRLGDATAISLLNLDDDIAQVQLTEGRLDVRVRRLEPGQSVEIDTPHLAFTLRQPGAYRIDVEPDGAATTIRMRDGEGEVTGEGGAYLVQAPQIRRFVGDAIPDDAYAGVAQPPDDFDRWAIERDRRAQQSLSARYVSPDVIGYEDLDDEGSWSVEASYGNVWYPRRVAVDWAPYRQGHWTWIDPWGWTWVDDAPWGFAVSHYGRWAHIRGRWGWIPGPVRTRAYYAPALVVFIGGPNFSLSISAGGSGGIAWFPLGPREVYRPAYRVSPRYFEQVNVSNTVINKTVIQNTYVTKVTNITNVTYVNRRVPGAVVAVPNTAFAQSQSVAKVVIKPSKEVIEGRTVVTAAPVAPTEKSVRGTALKGHEPPPRAFARTVVARTAPPPPKPSFAVQRERLAAQPGQPLDDEQRQDLRAASSRGGASAPAEKAAPPAPAVKVVGAKTPAPAPAAAREPARAEGRASQPGAEPPARPRAQSPASAPREARASEPTAAPEPREAPKVRKAVPTAKVPSPAQEAGSAVRERPEVAPPTSTPAARPPRPAASAAERRPPAAERRPPTAERQPPAAAEGRAPAPSPESRQAERAQRRAEKASAAAEKASEPRRQRNADGG
ncbi:DUF6600 domain-containing protein [Ideonella sp.]|uniref:DUF6600 domain-containing protein n=1 Tax=Ideonella sp. TaxID=1929293 RepID=UPI002B492F53|nr:DUF6600 domain-containing protein [Ideonella sp.]HJV68456.1 DUF6600 domain-containing protein [Ideonella sp.]